MSLSSRLTEIIEKVFTSKNALNTNIYLDFDTVLGGGLNSYLSGPYGFTAHGISTTTENIITPLSSVINLNSLTYPSSAQKVYVASTSASDNISGTGAYLVAINGLDANYNEVTDVVGLNGQTGVQSNLSFIRVNALFILSYGSSNVKSLDERFSAGNIYVACSNSFIAGVPTDPIIGIDGTNADTFLRETANRESIYSVPANTFMFLKEYQVGSEINKATRVSLHVRLYGEDFFRMLSPQTLTEGLNNITLNHVFAIPPKSDLQLRTKNVAGSQNSFTTANVVGPHYDYTHIVGGI